MGLTSVGIKLRVVQVVQNLLDGLDSSIPLDMLVPPSCPRDTHCLGRNVHFEVTSDEELATHIGGIAEFEALEAVCNSSSCM